MDSRIWVANSQGRCNFHPEKIMVPAGEEFIDEGEFVEKSSLGIEIHYLYHPKGLLLANTLELVGEFTKVSQSLNIFSSVSESERSMVYGKWLVICLQCAANLT